MLFVYIVAAVFIYLLFKLLQARYVFNQVKQRNEFELRKIEIQISENRKNPLLYCIRGSIYLNNQDYILANQDFKIALSLLADEPNLLDNSLKSDILLNLKFTEKPFPWSKGGIKNFSNNWVIYLLLKGFGNSRYTIK